MISILEELNPPQREAVTHLDGPLLILAGAGSGKTRVITHRIAYLLRQGIEPWSILAMTFTNKAAREMKGRVEKLIGMAAQSVWVATFHSTCVRILRRAGQDFTIYDEADRTRLIKDCLKDLNIDEGVYNPTAVAKAISRAKEGLISPQEYPVEYRFHRVVKQVYELYEDRLAENKAYDFDDLLGKVIELWQKSPETLNIYQDRFKHIMVDEYQDTNHIQYRLVKMLTAKHHNICVVGDDDQSIYSWRGADLTNILNFEHDYPEVRVIRLEQNYRSTKQILKSASDLIRNNVGRKGKTLWTAKENGEQIECCSAIDEYEEARLITRKIDFLKHTEQRPWSDFALFYRTNAQSRVLEEIFRENMMPYTIVGGTSFYQRREIKDILAYLRVIVNPADSVSLKRIINLPPRGISDRTISTLEEIAQTHSTTLYQALDLAGQGQLLPSRAGKAVASFLKLINYFRQLKEGLSPSSLATKVMEESGYQDYLKEDDHSDDRLGNLEELVAAMEKIDDLESFLVEASLVSDIDQWEENNRISLMTAHNAKGLEFPVVFITGLENGLFPHVNSIDEGRLEEERRLCYVGMTRAKERLYLTWAKRRRNQLRIPSGFISEAGLGDGKNSLTNPVEVSKISSGYYDRLIKQSRNKHRW
ncbi:MAG: UvrD-helicase domain-containing protein [bacterium]